MKIREHRELLSDSMNTIAEIAPTIEAVAKFIRERLKDFPGVQIAPSLIHVKHYTYDDRIKWDTYIVTLDGYGVFGFTDSPLSA